MANVVDSKQEPLPAPTILTMAAQDLDLKGVTVEAAMLGLAHELSMPNVDQVQVGNTVFVGHRGKGKSKNKMVGRAFNVDTARNFVSNYIKYLSVLQKKGITHYSTSFTGSEVLKLMQLLQRIVKNNTDSRIYIAIDDTDPYAESDYITYFKVGKDPMPRVS